MYVADCAGSATMWLVDAGTSRCGNDVAPFAAACWMPLMIMLAVSLSTAAAAGGSEDAAASGTDVGAGGAVGTGATEGSYVVAGSLMKV